MSVYPELNSQRFPISRRKMFFLCGGFVCSALFQSRAQQELGAPAPSKKFRVATAVLKGKADLDVKTSGSGESPEKSVSVESLFILNDDNKPVYEFSESFRREKDAEFPTYQAFWSNDSSRVAGVARFRRDAGLAASVFADDKWNSLDVPKWNPVPLARERLGITGNGTYEWEIVSAKWDAAKSGLLIDVIVSFKTPVSKQVEIIYRFNGATNILSTAPEVISAEVQD